MTVLATVSLEGHRHSLADIADWKTASGVSADGKVQFHRAGKTVFISGEVTVPSGAAYVDVTLPDWAASSVVTGAKWLFSAGYVGAAANGVVFMSNKLVRIFGEATNKYCFSTSYPI